jgi:hypothetical protein
MIDNKRKHRALDSFAFAATCKPQRFFGPRRAKHTQKPKKPRRISALRYCTTKKTQTQWNNFYFLADCAGLESE